MPTAQPRLLIVEDDEAVRLQLKYALQRDFALTFAEDRAQAMAAARIAIRKRVLITVCSAPSESP